MTDESRPDASPGEEVAQGTAVATPEEEVGKKLRQQVEIKGDLEDVKKGEVEIERKDDFTTIELKFSGREEKARIPTPWFAAGRDDDERDYQVVVQRVDVDDVKVLGACRR